MNTGRWTWSRLTRSAAFCSLPAFILTLGFTACHRETDHALVHAEGSPASFQLRLDGVQVDFKLAPAVPDLNRYFKILGRVSELPQGAELGFIHVDARMPSHGHGMTTEPATRIGEDGRFATEGMKLHMFGPWVFSVHLRLSSGQSLRFEQTFEYGPRLRG